jgi:hypothetical protein
MPSRAAGARMGDRENPGGPAVMPGLAQSPSGCAGWSSAAVGAAGKLPCTLGGDQHQLEAVIHILEAIFNGNACHETLQKTGY